MGVGAAIVVCALAVAVLLGAERLDSQRGKWLAKPVASAAFVATALLSGALDSDYGRLLLLGLVLCMLGDLLLVPTGRVNMFRGGLFAFLAGHLAYAAAFLTQPLSNAWLALAAVVLALVLLLLWRWLRPALPAEMRLPVQAYFVVIGAMAVLACALTGAGGPGVVAAGALAFAASDVAVARDRFVCPQFLNRAWGLPLYYLAQLLLALSPAAIT